MQSEKIEKKNFYFFSYFSFGNPTIQMSSIAGLKQEIADLTLAVSELSDKLAKKIATLKEQELQEARKHQFQVTKLIFVLDTKLSGNQLEILSNILGLKEPHSLANLDKSVRGLNMEDTATAEKVNLVLERLKLLESKLKN
jgi:hypothetical protein